MSQNLNRKEALPQNQILNKNQNFQNEQILDKENRIKPNYSSQIFDIEKTNTNHLKNQETPRFKDPQQNNLFEIQNDYQDKETPKFKQTNSLEESFDSTKDSEEDKKKNQNNDEVYDPKFSFVEENNQNLPNSQNNNPDFLPEKISNEIIEKTKSRRLISLGSRIDEIRELNSIEKDSFKSQKGKNQKKNEPKIQVG